MSNKITHVYENYGNGLLILFIILFIIFFIGVYNELN